MYYADKPIFVIIAELIIICILVSMKKTFFQFFRKVWFSK